MHTLEFSVNTHINLQDFITGQEEMLKHDGPSTVNSLHIFYHFEWCVKIIVILCTSVNQNQNFSMRWWYLTWHLLCSSVTLWFSEEKPTKEYCSCRLYSLITWSKNNKLYLCIVSGKCFISPTMLPKKYWWNKTIFNVVGLFKIGFTV